MRKSLIVNSIIFIIVFAFSYVYATDTYNTTSNVYFGNTSTDNTTSDEHFDNTNTNNTTSDANTDYTKWDVHFENINILYGSVAAIQEPTIDEENKLDITFSVNLNTPGDFYEFTVDVVNDGNIDAMVDEINNSILTIEERRYLSFEETYFSGVKVNKYDLLKAGKRVKLRVKLKFRTDITADDLPKEDTSILLSLSTTYVEADENAHEVEEDIPPKPNSGDDNKPEDNKPDNNGNGSDNNKSNNNDGIGNDENNKDDNNKSIWSFIKNPKTGDVIIKYVIICILAGVAIFITKKKSNK